MDPGERQGKKKKILHPDTLYHRSIGSTVLRISPISFFFHSADAHCTFRTRVDPAKKKKVFIRHSSASYPTVHPKAGPTASVATSTRTCDEDAKVLIRTWQHLQRYMDGAMSRKWWATPSTPTVKGTPTSLRHWMAYYSVGE